ncbi:MAG TPA: serine O-acetyltransferase [Candidatus Merdivicinus excrementipullorum]|uniref:Serine acetyltransferase n=1 Tax=Candidatus Merdivicinus excrementipullorum TaxID=2840867 RepID=A0A9D1FNS7_9FIRM|nr:serine O-acetyltransferase [Candidatus Merdivicinus excrementipullorum]
MLNRLRADIRAVKERDPAARNSAEILLLYSGLHAVMLHRPAYFLYRHRFYFLARLISQTARFLTGIEIHPGAKIGTGVFLDHGSGIVIGETAEVGDGCTLYQGVTLGGTGKDHGKRHPTLGQNVLVGSGAKILGPFTVGDNAKIAAGAVVLEPIPPDSTAVGVPAHVVRQGGRRTCKPMDQVHIPDPVSQEFCKILMRLERAEKTIAEQQKELELLRGQLGGNNQNETV